jgi:hypothetical protein
MKRKIIGFRMHENSFTQYAGGKLEKNVNAHSYPGIEMEYNKNETIIICMRNGKGFDVPVVNCQVIEWVADGECK